MLYIHVRLHDPLGPFESLAFEYGLVIAGSTTDHPKVIGHLLADGRIYLNEWGHFAEFTITAAAPASGAMS